ncbi:unnamed protein product [Mytilus coruscus]|uniref:Uncharacterized protein n=1 Tax=Mytilus coruscus TaxID=42192 RepID=A0A6J8BFQ7_MYTCO|nr:unnamed protein product [Mytilus coruscus]
MDRGNNAEFNDRVVKVGNHLDQWDNGLYTNGTISGYKRSLRKRQNPRQNTENFLLALHEHTIVKYITRCDNCAAKKQLQARKAPMRPLNLDECWICQQQFHDQKTLKRHLASIGTHGGRLSVVWLWCFSYEKRFSRISDLKCHLEEKHPEVGPKLEKNFMSEANGYWFSVFPEDYMRLVSKMTPKGSSAAVQARSNVTSWLGKCKSIRRMRQSWVEDWANHPRDCDVVGTPRQGTREPSVESAVSGSKMSPPLAWKKTHQWKNMTHLCHQSSLYTAS